MTETVFLRGDEYFAALLADVAAAKHAIDLETYIFANDKLGLMLIDALSVASQRGVKVRILVDGAGTSGWSLDVARKLASTSIEIRFYHPFLWRFWQWRHTITRLPFLKKTLYFLTQANKRNHRKVCHIDHQILYIGSANISQCHLSEAQGGEGWRDTVVRLTKFEKKEWQEAFHAAWNHVTIQERFHHIFEPVNLNADIRLNYTRHRRRMLYKNLVRRIAKCRHRVWITNAYFVPDNFLLRKLIERANLGVDVRVILPQKTDVMFLSWASSAFYQRLLKAGVRIFEYLPSMLHAKTLILDDWFLIGSSNLNHRSLLHDLEVDVVIHEAENRHKIEMQFMADISDSRELDLTSWNKRNWFQKLAGRMILYLKYWL